MEWTSAKNILAVRLDGLGDLLMTVPALRALKTSTPGRRVTLLASAAGTEAVPMIPAVDSVISHDAPWMKASAQPRAARADLELIERLRNEDFDAAVIFTVFSQNPLPAALACYLAEIQRRAAYCRENPYQLLTDWLPEPDSITGMRHEVRRHLDLIASLGCQTADERMSLRVPLESRLKAVQRIRCAGIKPVEQWVVIHPGATAASRRYAPSQFAAVVRSLSYDHGLPLVFTGSRSERPLVDAICDEAGCDALNLAGELTLAELAGLLSIAPVLLSNNTGPVHVAASVGTPVVDLYALTNPQHTPWGVPHRVLSHDVPCRNCFKSICPETHHHCLALVRPESVVAAVRDLLQETHGCSWSASRLLELEGEFERNVHAWN